MLQQTKNQYSWIFNQAHTLFLGTKIKGLHLINLASSNKSFQLQVHHKKMPTVLCNSSNSSNQINTPPEIQLEIIAIISFLQTQPTNLGNHIKMKNQKSNPRIMLGKKSIK